jgi:hypothetical protein
VIRSELQVIDVTKRQRKRFRAGALMSTIVLGGVLGSGSLRPTQAAAQTATAEDPVLLRELVLRMSADGWGGKSNLLVGALQTVTPAFSLPSGWRVIGAVVRDSPNGSRSSASTTEFGQNYVDAPTGNALEAISALTKSMTTGGWILRPDSVGNQGGFVEANSPQPAYAQFCSSAYNLSVSAYKDASGPVRVSLMANSTAAGFPIPCGTSGGPTATVPSPLIPLVYGQLPRLVLPEKAVLVNSGGGGGSQYSSAAGLTIDKADSPTVLESIFAPQMVEAGWQKVGGVTAETASVSTWRKTFSGTPLQATLVIVNAIGGDQRRDLTITISQEAKAGEYSGGPFPLAVPVMTVVPSVGGIAPPTTLAIASGPPTLSARSGSAATKKASVKKSASTKSVKKK